jgi:predicted nucleic acid-binding protein
VSLYFLEATAFAKLFVREQGTDPLIQLMESVEDNSKLISAGTPLEVYGAIRRRERAGDITEENAASALDSLRLEAARMVQQPLNPAVLETARLLLDHTKLRWPAALQLSAALTARDLFQGAAITFISTSPALLEAAASEGMKTLDATQDATVDPAREPAGEAE